MPVCSIVKTITPRCRGRPDALLHEAEEAVHYFPFGSSLAMIGLLSKRSISENKGSNVLFGII